MRRRSPPLSATAGIRLTTAATNGRTKANRTHRRLDGSSSRRSASQSSGQNAGGVCAWA